jgi:hypothetical protein
MTGRLPAVLGLALVAGSLYGAFAGPAGTAGATGTPASPSCTTLGGTATCTFLYTGAEQPFVVPATASSVTGTAVGAQGQSTTTTSNAAAPRASGGEGAEASGTLDVASGQTVYVEIGGTGATGGWNGGGHGGTDANGTTLGGHGGGASDVRTRSIASTATAGSTAQTLASRLLVAGGGGGGGWHGYTNRTTPIDGGAGGHGGAAGTSGAGASTSGAGASSGTCSATGGGGGTPGETDGGKGGSGTPAAATPGNPGTTGSAGSGGAGGSYTHTGGGSGGGGGGGYVGGGGGGAGGTTYVATVCDALSGSGGGGGGSSYTAATGQIAGTPAKTPAEVTITWTGALPAPSAADLGYTVAEGKVLHVAAGAALLSNGTSYGATLALTAEPAHGTVTLSRDGAFTYTPTADFAGTDTFRYEETNTAGSSTGTVTLDVVPTTLYVRQGSGGTTCSTPTSGTSSSDACGSIATAVARAHTMTGGILVTVGPGTYAGGIAIGSTPRYSSLTIRGETGAAHTKITGGGSERDVTITTSTDATDKPVRIVTLSGLTITNGESATSGGAVVTVDGADTLTDDVISTDVSSNNSGGAVWNDAGADTFTGDTFSHDHSRYHGGAVRTYLGTSGFTGDTFSTDVATTGVGGAVFGGFGADTFTGDTFSHDAAVNGGAVGISAELTTTPNGPERGTSSATFTDDTFSNDTAEEGGAVMSTGTLGTETAVFTDDTFATDHATGDGGAVSSVGTDGTARATFVDDTFAGDYAPAAGAVSNSANKAAYSTSTASATFVDDTFRDDRATGGSSGTSGALGNSGSASIDASILDGSTCPGENGGSLSGAYDVSTTSTCAIGTTSVQETTLHLATTLATTSSYPTAPATLALLFTSPAIDEVPCTLTGLPPTDERGAPRPPTTAGRACDAGAYQFAEVEATPSVTITPSPMTLTLGIEAAKTFTVIVHGTPGNGYPEGTITTLSVTGTAESISCTESLTHPGTDTTRLSCHLTSGTALPAGTYSNVTTTFTPDTKSSSRRGYAYRSGTSSAQTFTVAKATPTTPTITNLPTSGVYGGGFTATVATDGDGTTSVTSNATSVCTASGLVVTYVGAGTCSLTAHVGPGTGYSAASGSPQTFAVTPGSPSPATGVVATPDSATTTITLTWSPPSSNGGSPITGYEILRATSPGQEGSTPIATVTGTSYTDSAAVPGTTYYYVIVAVTAAGTSVPSAEVSAELPVAGPTGRSFAATPGGGGWWIVHPDGGVFAYGSAGFYGSLPGLGISVDDIVGVTGTPDAKGYWLVGAHGGVFSFGDAAFYGSMGGKPLNQSIVDIASTPDGKGYWLVAADGGVFAFGDAAFYGSTGAIHLNQPVVVMAPAPNGQGYWLVAADGGIFAFGDAPYDGSMGGKPLNQSVVGIASTPDGKGYWLVAADGGVFAFGDAPYDGSLGGTIQPSPILGLAPLTGGGYELIRADGTATRFGS